MSTATIEAGPLVALATELERQKETRRDLIADTRRVSLESLADSWESETGNEPGLLLNVDLPDGVEAFGVKPYAHKQIATHLGIPGRFYDRLLNGVADESDKRKFKPAQPGLLADLANGLLARQPSKQMLRTLDGNVRAFLSNRYRPRDNWEVLDGAILPALMDFPARIEIKQATLTETRLYLKLFLPDLAVPVTPKVGDVIRGGLIFSNSEVGAGALYIYPYSDKLDCLNGMVHTEYGQRNVHLGRALGGDGDGATEFFSDETLRLDDEAFFAKIKDTVRGVLNRTIFESIASDMRDLADERLTDIPAAVEVVAKQHSFTESEQTSFLNAIISGGDTSAWGFVNGITRMARDLDDADRQTELEILAGNLVSNREWAPKLAAQVA